MKREFTKGSDGKVTFVLTAENKKEEWALSELMKLANAMGIQHSFEDTEKIEIENLFEKCKKFEVGQYRYFELSKKPNPGQIEHIEDRLNITEHSIKHFHLLLHTDNKIEVFCDTHDHPNW
jgi:hypothetical protein